MLTVPESLSQTFEAQLSLRKMPDQQRRDFHKWLRFYLDFCAKYGLNVVLTRSFAGFDDKLKSKGQSDSQRQQTRRSVAIYYRMIGVIQSPEVLSGNPSVENAFNSLSSDTGCKFAGNGDDVKGFLSHLAMNKQVAASSQN
jgi:hypothetical protein